MYRGSPRGLRPTPPRLPLGLTGAGTLLHGDEDETHSRGQQQVHGLVQQLGRENAPDEEVVAQDRHQDDVGGGRHRPQQGQAVAAVADGDRAPVGRGEKRTNQSGCGFVFSLSAG